MRDDVAKPCSEYGGTSPLAGGMSQVRITDPDQGLCEKCAAVARENELEFVEMWPPRDLSPEDVA